MNVSSFFFLHTKYLVIQTCRPYQNSALLAAQSVELASKTGRTQFAPTIVRCIVAAICDHRRSAITGDRDRPPVSRERDTATQEPTASRLPPCAGQTPPTSSEEGFGISSLDRHSVYFALSVFYGRIRRFQMFPDCSHRPRSPAAAALTRAPPAGGPGFFRPDQV